MNAARWYRDLYSDAVWESETLNAAEKAVAETYARHARDERGEKSAAADRAWVTYPRLMAKAGIGRRAKVAEVVDRLEEAGWLEVLERVSRRATLYRLTIPGGSDAGTTDLVPGRNYGSSDGGTTAPEPVLGASSDAGTTVVPLPDHGSSVFASGSSDGGTQPLVPLELQPLTTTSSSCADDPQPLPDEGPKEGEGDQEEKTAEQITSRYRDRISFVEAKRLAPLIADALRRGWTQDAVTAELDQPTDGLRSVAAGLITRARTLGEPPPPEQAPAPKRPWCGRCDEISRFRKTESNYGEGIKLVRCSDCGPDPYAFDLARLDRNRRPAADFDRGWDRYTRRPAFRNPNPADYDLPL